MAGGRGTRLEVPCEKPLFELCNKPLIKYVIDNLKESKLIDKIVIAVSHHTRETTEYLNSLAMPASRVITSVVEAKVKL